MDMFQYSQQVREEILRNCKIFAILREHFLGVNPLTENLGGGISHTHFRVGKLENGLWVATREPTLYAKAGLEAYCRDAEYEYQLMKERNLGIKEIIDKLNGKEDVTLATSFAVGIKYRKSLTGEFYYALLVEDLTCGGSIEYEEKEDHGSKKIKGTNIEVRFDLEDIWPDELKYMVDKNMLIIEPTPSKS